MYIYFINKCCGSLDFNRNRLRFSLVYSIGLVWFGLAWQRRQKNMFFMTSVVCPRAIHFPSTKYKKKLNKSRAKLQLHPKPSAYGVDHLRFIYFFFAISYCLFACSVARAADAPTLAHTHTRHRRPSTWTIKQFSRTCNQNQRLFARCRFLFENADAPCLINTFDCCFVRREKNKSLCWRESVWHFQSVIILNVTHFGNRIHFNVHCVRY